VNAVVGWVRVPLVLILALVLQLGFVAELPVAGMIGDIVLVIALASAMVAGAQAGAVLAFAAGALVDLTLSTPFGLTALAYCLVAYAIGRALSEAIHPVWWTAPLTIAVGGAAEVGIYALLAAVVGRDELLGVRTLEAMAMVAVVGAVLAPLAVRVARWMLRGAMDLRT
jgi:rod shape-determining protein MreD